MLADYWGLAVLPPTELAATADEITHATAASTLEQLQYLNEAKTAYQSILKKWPGSFSALIGLGNIAYSMKDFSGSVRILKQAVRRHPESPVAWHNLAIAEGAAKMVKAAHNSALRALAIAAPMQVPEFRKSLNEWSQ